MSDKVHFSDYLSDGKPRLMGIVNVTPDSFSDGGKFINVDKAIEHGVKLISEGADILDIGGESTRPGAQVVDIDEEIKRVQPVIEGLRDKAPWISIDTRNAKTMEAALKSGANIINDISALDHDSRSVSLVAEAGVPVILMHMQGNPQSMQNNPVYNNVLEDVLVYLEGRIEYFEAHRIDKKNVVLDPGIGFGKTTEDNLVLLRNIRDFLGFDLPVLLGASRKSFIGRISEGEVAGERLGGSLASVLWGMSQGVRLFRVHDVAQTKQAIKIYQAISEAG